MSLPPHVLSIVRESELQRTIEDMLDWAHLLHFHDEDARRDEAGLPDLIFPRPPVLHLWELKTQRGQLRTEQAKWAAQLLRCTSIDYRVVRPEHLDQVREYLGFRRGG